MMISRVVVLPEAQEDIIDIYSYVALHDSVDRAEALLDHLELKSGSLQHNPTRGHKVPELQRVYVEGYREIHDKPSRMIYQIRSDTVFIHAVLDGRRDLQELLERRLLR